VRGGDRQHQLGLVTEVDLDLLHGTKPIFPFGLVATRKFFSAVRLKFRPLT